MARLIDLAYKLTIWIVAIIAAVFGLAALLNLGSEGLARLSAAAIVLAGWLAFKIIWDATAQKS
ncbi:hypothetical protein CCAL12920_00705 [Campylobacter sp. RM12920]|uniref:DUF1328 domain-containing protein n=1 Tax=Campylobacter californiensis TaxID=1032243 RepID=A0ABD4JGX8_9BACT|nr:hypothetical protein [Campylobacter sp. RM12919]MBE2987420.1 hypothetical protein [Campylobacter sp. RM12920]